MRMFECLRRKAGFDALTENANEATEQTDDAEETVSDDHPNCNEWSQPRLILANYRPCFEQRRISVEAERLRSNLCAGQIISLKI